MYFSPLKTMIIFTVCTLGILFCLPNLVAAPASWMPWHQVHLGLDLRGGSYLLMEVDMNSVVKERLNSLVDETRQALQKADVFYRDLAAQPKLNRVSLLLPEPSQQGAALAALNAIAKGMNAPDFTVGVQPDGSLALTLSTPALLARATQAVQQSIEIVRRRIDATGIVDPQITRQGTDRIVVQLPGVSDPNRIRALLGTTAHMTFHLVDETANLAGPPPPGVAFLPMQDNPRQKIAVRQRVDVDGADLTDARAGQNGQTGQWVVNFSFDSTGARQFADGTRANV
ncbi:MAG: SecDF P1 head subdomain-containing protein, partial [Acetobacteraceae bacterium]